MIHAPAEHGFTFSFCGTAPARSPSRPPTGYFRWAAGRGSGPDPQPKNSAEHGFTLVEMLIALAIFAMLSVAGVMLLRSSIDTQQAIATRLDGEGGLTRLRAMLGTELSSAQGRVRRGDAGERLPALVGDAGHIDFVYATEGEPGAPAIARVSYSIADGKLVRSSARHADGALDAEAATIVENVRAARWRYRAADGSWAESWAAQDPASLPVAVELTLDSAAAPDLSLRFLVAPDGARLQQEPPA